MKTGHESPCPQCEFIAKWESSLKAHQKTVHDNLENFLTNSSKRYTEIIDMEVASKGSSTMGEEHQVTLGKYNDYKKYCKHCEKRNYEGKYLKQHMFYLHSNGDDQDFLQRTGEEHQVTLGKYNDYLKQNNNKLLPNIIRRKEAVEVNNADDSLLSTMGEEHQVDNLYYFSERTSKLGGEFSNSSTAGSILDDLKNGHESYFQQCEVSDKWESNFKAHKKTVHDNLENFQTKS